MADKSLPPMPPSGGEAFDRNYSDGYYQVKARDFWEGNHIVREEIGPDVKCEHKFRAVPTGVECSMCRFGLIGPIEVRDGKLYHKGEQLPL